MDDYLLDTNALFFLFAERQRPPAALEPLFEAALIERAYLSPVNAWEIGFLSHLPTGAKLGFSEHPNLWLEELMARTNLQMLPLSARAAIMAAHLPGDFHKDPADRLLVASAIDFGATFVTRDTKILGWAERTGAMRVLAC
jgi:PIN domain nuclease of toxin-antitoxin system